MSLPASPILWPLGCLLAIAALWETLCRLFDVPAFVLPTPSAALQALWLYREVLGVAAGQTLWVTLAGFAMAIVAGLVGGTAIGASQRLYQGLYPALIGFNCLPKVALVPILVVWLGVGVAPSLVSVFLMSFSPVLINVAAGVASVEREPRDAMRVLGARWHHVLWRLALPQAMPYFFASLRIAVSAAFVGAILAETIASDRGIGHLIVAASSRLQVPLAFAALLLTAAMGIALYLLIVLAERRVLAWRQPLPAAPSAARLRLRARLPAGSTSTSLSLPSSNRA